MILTRRKVLLGALALPSMGSSAPLVDLDAGGGLFTKVAYRGDNTSEGFRNLYGDTQTPARVAPQKAPQTGAQGSLRLAFHNINTKEKMPLRVSANGKLNASQLSKLHYFLRDWRQNEIKNIDESVLKTLIGICGNFAPRSGALDVRITSGYRSKATNNMLRRSSSGVARRSLHLQGRAIDFSLPNVSISQLSKMAQKVCPGGVGTYNSFVHIDSGPKRSWARA
jgi:uncharacterized protein YcbK (DUF882 family)